MEPTEEQPIVPGYLAPAAAGSNSIVIIDGGMKPTEEQAIVPSSNTVILHLDYRSKEGSACCHKIATHNNLVVHTAGRNITTILCECQLELTIDYVRPADTCTVQ